MRLQPRDRFMVEAEPEILASFEVIREVTNGITIDYTKVPADANGDRKIQKGMPMAKITSSGKWRPYTGGLALAANVSGSATTATLNDVSRLVVGDTIKFYNGTNTENKTITAIDYTTKVITFTAITNAYTTANGVLTNDDGGDSPTIILKRGINVKDGDHVVGGYEVGKFITERIPVTVDAALRAKMPHIVFA
ncbi:hypothetical protein [Paenibacillus koleovorans]|uniref:hypothetical protein n=1 Tax=Paenibacillus koleovorans TaxID=121608 RepID=UPI00158080E4|nr:hypothetical protein [Paenibacillus koleovorans]